MPFQKGNNLGGRKTFVYEQADLKRMRKLFRAYLTLGEVVNKGKATDAQKDAFERLKALCLKIADKLHANKQDVKLDFDKPFMILK